MEHYGALLGIMEGYGALCRVMECYRALWRVIGNNGGLWRVMKSYYALRSVTVHSHGASALALDGGCVRSLVLA